MVLIGYQLIMYIVIFVLQQHELCLR